MNEPDNPKNESNPLDEMELLAAALCDGHITSTEVCRLEELARQSKEARRFLMRYIQLHGELYWDTAAGTRVEGPCSIEQMFDTGTPRRSAIPTSTRSAGPAVARRFRPRTIVAAAVAAAAILAAVFIGLPDRNGDEVVQPGPPPVLEVARLGATHEAQWVMPGSDTAIPTGAKLAAGRRLELARGLAEISFDSGAGIILEGPAVFEPTSENGGYLHSGRLAANVPVGAAGFSVHTPSAVIVDLGTEFGVAVEDDGTSEVQVFSGNVEISPGGVTGDESSVCRVHDGQTTRIDPSAASVADVVYLASANHRFVRTMPIPRSSVGSAARLRALVAKHPRLIHHYPFEGTTRAEKCQDCRGDLHLAEAVMHTGRGGGQIDYTAEGFDSTTECIAPYRASQSGNSVGVGLQSEDEFIPPDTMTVELLLELADVKELHDAGFVSTALATRADELDCGFLVAVAEQGNLVHLLDGDADWVESGEELVPGDWYYVAVTFRVRSDQTLVNTYLANLDDERSTLVHVVQNHEVPGLPAASRLGIGKGFDFTTAHAYPWSGSIDEVAVYDDVLDVETLREHHLALTGSSRSR